MTESQEFLYQVRPLPIGTRLSLTHLTTHLRTHSPLSRESARALILGCLHGTPVRVLPYRSVPFRRRAARLRGDEFIVAAINAVSREKGTVYLLDSQTGEVRQLALNTLGLIRASYPHSGNRYYWTYAEQERDPNRLDAYYHPEAYAAYTALAGVQ
jgi:hypothetical protein